MSQFLNVKIIAPKEEVFTGQATSVSSINSQGKFDILPQHANFITIIENQPLIIRTIDKKILNFKFPLAIISVTQDKVNIYTDIQLSLK